MKLVHRKYRHPPKARRQNGQDQDRRFGVEGEGKSKVVEGCLLEIAGGYAENS